MTWLKKQFTEFTALTGFLLILCAFLAPRWVFVLIGVLLISIDDEKAKELAAKVAPELVKKLDEWISK